MADRSADWLRQAERDIRLAEISSGAGLHEWSCFAAQQAAEKAVKALAQSLGADAWGHSILHILDELAEADDTLSSLRDDAARLDQLYIPPRYPNGFASGAPGDYYTREQSDDALDRARRIVDLVRRRLPRP